MLLPQIEIKYPYFLSLIFHEIKYILENDFSSDDGSSESYRRSEEEAHQFAKDL